MGLLGGLLGGKSGGSSTQKSESNPWKPAQGQLKDILAQAQGLFNQQGGINPNNQQQVADLNSGYSNMLNQLMNNTTANQMTQAGTNAINTATGINSAANSYLSNATGNSLGDTTSNLASAAGNLINNDLLNSQIQTAQNDIYKNLQQSTYTGINSTAAGTGNTNSSRTSLERGLAAAGANTQAANVDTTMRGNAYANAISQAQNAQNSAISNYSQLANNSLNSVNAASNLSTTGTNSLIAGMNAGNAMQNYNQSVLDTQYSNSQLGWQNLSNYYNLVAGIGGLGGTSSNTTTQKTGGSSLFNSLLGAGASLGGAYISSLG